MRILLQRVSEASVTVDEAVVGRIGPGLVLLVGVSDSDDQATADRLADKIVHLRIFNDDAGKFNRSLLDVEGSALVVSQFTLFADCRKGRRPSFTGAGKPDHAAPLCDYFSRRLQQLGVKNVATGRFGAHMHVNIQNHGPVTIWLEDESS